MNQVNRSIGRLPKYAPASYNLGIQSSRAFDRTLVLHCNENPRGPSPQVLKAMASVERTLNRYPDSDGLRLRARLAERLGITLNQLTLGCGSSGVLDLISRVCLDPNCEAIVDQYCFTLYPILISTVHGEVVTVPAKNWHIDFDEFLCAINPNTRLVFITNPSNPLGSCTEPNVLENFLDAVPKDVWVVLDEAYFEYTRPKFDLSVQLCQKYQNLIVTRTFSKVYGLAGLRVGYAIASETLTELLNRVRPPFNVSTLGLVGAEAALNDQEYVDECLELNDAGRDYLYTEFARLGLECLTSRGNFITFDCGRNAEKVRDRFDAQGILVRTLTNYNLPNHLRVTIGLPQENRQFITALERILQS